MTAREQSGTPSCETCLFMMRVDHYQKSVVGPLGVVDAPFECVLILCHRYPQSVVVSNGHWCGEYRRGAQAKNKERAKQGDGA